MIVFVTMTTEERQNKNSRIEELLSALARGDTAAMGALYDLIRTDVFAYALSKTGKKQEADDITHDTFIQIYRYAKQYRPKGKPMAWIVTIELNLIRKRYRQNARYAGFDESFQSVSTGENLEETVVENTFLRALLETLNEAEREVVSLRVVTGLKHKEIAKLTGEPLSTVLSRYNRAIKKLQLIVKEGK